MIICPHLQQLAALLTASVLTQSQRFTDTSIPTDEALLILGRSRKNICRKVIWLLTVLNIFCLRIVGPTVLF